MIQIEGRSEIVTHNGHKYEIFVFHIGEYWYEFISPPDEPDQMQFVNMMVDSYFNAKDALEYSIHRLPETIEMKNLELLWFG